MALSADRNTPMKDGELVNVPVATNTKIYAGALVALNASGYATPGAVAATLTYLGRAEEQTDNTGGADAIVQADLGKTCYIVDDETVAKTDGTATRSAAGKVVGLDSDSVWVE